MNTTEKRIIWVPGLFVLGAAALAGCAASSEEPAFRKVTQEEAMTMMEKESGDLILDVSTRGETVSGE